MSLGGVNRALACACSNSPYVVFQTTRCGNELRKTLSSFALLFWPANQLSPRFSRSYSHSLILILSDRTQHVVIRILSFSAQKEGCKCSCRGTAPVQSCSRAWSHRQCPSPCFPLLYDAKLVLVAIETLVRSIQRFLRFLSPINAEITRLGLRGISQVILIRSTRSK